MNKLKIHGGRAIGPPTPKTKSETLTPQKTGGKTLGKPVPPKK